MACLTGATRKCGEDPDLHALGNCAEGSETCTAGAWSGCSVAARAADSCAVDDDANCNGTKNDGCPCVDGAQQSCGPADVGECRHGTQSCVGSAWGPCAGAIVAKPRDCTSGLDVDCDGAPDNKVDAICKCTAGAVEDCDAHVNKDGKGPCHAGTRTCAAAADKKSTAFSACTGSVGPAAIDTCEVGNDNNCNGVPNEGCSCVNGTTQPCGPSLAVGVCKPGTQGCAASAWGACSATYATGRDCSKTTDGDCNGVADQSEASCECAPGATRACTTTLLGPCKPGTQSCVMTADKKSSSWGECVGTAKAAKDTCDPGNDANCNGVPNEGCACVNGTTRSCGSDVGNCVAGKQTCASSAWSTSCVGEVKPSARDCTQPGDHDCLNGEDQLETACTTPCKLGATLAGCATGKLGACARGTQACVASADHSTVAWGACVAPLPKTDSCSPPDDADCNGTVGTGCCATATDPLNCGSCGHACPLPTPASSGVARCVAGVCSKACSVGFHTCSGSTTDCVSDTTVASCGPGPTCSDCRQPNAVAHCGGSPCANSCIGTTLLGCGAPGGRPACGSWDFESGGVEGWRNASSLTGVDGSRGTFAVRTTRASSGTSSLAIGHDNTVDTFSAFSTLSINLCPGGQSVDVSRFTLTAQMYADPTVGGDLNMGGFDGELFARASNGATILGDGDLRFPTWPMLPVRQWVTISISLSGYATTVTQLDMNFRTFSKLPWTGTIYFDDIRIQ